MEYNVREYLRTERYLPKFLRGFHDQKDLFKTIHESIAWCDEQPEEVSWVAGHIYVIDIFLWFMAWHGYTLQKNRTKVDFDDIDKKINRHNEIRRNLGFKALKSALKDTTTKD